MKQNPCEKILFATFPKILAKTKMRNELKLFSKLVLFSKKMGKQLFVFKTKMSFKIF
jgi:hypothetical protein